MSDSDEKRMEILQLLAAGKLTVDEAGDMLASVGQPEQAVEVDLSDETIFEKQPDQMNDVSERIKVEPDPALEATKSKAARRPSWLRVRVSDMKSGKNKVTVNVPMGLVRFGLAYGSRFAPELKGFEWDEIDDYLSTESGMLVDVHDEEDGEHVQIFVE
jgi:hypothetical protein